MGYLWNSRHIAGRPQTLRGTCQRPANLSSPRRDARKPAMMRSVWSQLGEHGAQFGAQVATAGTIHRPDTVGQQQP